MEHYEIVETKTVRVINAKKPHTINATVLEFRKQYKGEDESVQGDLLIEAGLWLKEHVGLVISMNFFHYPEDNTFVLDVVVDDYQSEKTFRLSS